MQATVWKSIPVLRNLLCPSPHLAAFHSTPISLAKWKSKWDSKDEGAAEKPSKPSTEQTYIKYAVRQKRADAKKALKDFLLYGKSSKLHSQDDVGFRNNKTNSRKAKLHNSSHDFDNHTQSESFGKSKSQSSSSSGKGKHGGSKRWRNNQSFYDDDDCGPPETIFQAAFGGHRGFTWSFSSWENSYYGNSTSGFEWRDESRWEKTRRRVWSESDVDDESTDVGLHSHRLTLGLPPTGSLKLDDVKCAFRASALKWHPDKHQGSSQAMAEEKFKLCVDAYNSLCNALK